MIVDYVDMGIFLGQNYVYCRWKGIKDGCIKRLANYNYGCLFSKCNKYSTKPRVKSYFSNLIDLNYTIKVIKISILTI